MTFKKSLVAVEDVDAQPLINLEVLKSGRSEESSMIFAGLNASSILPEVEELAAEPERATQVSHEELVVASSTRNETLEVE